ncbi:MULTISPECIES: TRAP transporter small permease [Mammaliicoccus]|uniref:TRAP transporter small permease n=1 Tax=Mammaliicoccus TaxID=2803850 RepID=UPI001EFEB39F|nr:MULTISPECIES: TRAP transporter small permease subunit [Mammaliicoccus]MEB7724228.1 TRAP transporter small permease subunit [Mammaliicoccus fleurettii]MEB7779958.1 TRAP transporter small permease subunit [Mammaliicoccus fleurettii]MEB7805891.1 TRAP transporter small permease subunit [Mammaliicoccus fleurettii]
MNKLDILEKKFINILTHIMTFFMILSIAMILLQVLTRFIFKTSIFWSQEVLMLFFVYSILFGAVILMYKQEHLQVDLFEEMPAKINNILSYFVKTVITLVLLILVYYSILQVYLSIDANQVMTSIPIGRWIMYIPMPLCFLLMIYFTWKTGDES